MFFFHYYFYSNIIILNYCHHLKHERVFVIAFYTEAKNNLLLFRYVHVPVPPCHVLRPAPVVWWRVLYTCSRTNTHCVEPHGNWPSVTRATVSSELLATDSVTRLQNVLVNISQWMNKLTPFIFMYVNL